MTAGLSLRPGNDPWAKLTGRSDSRAIAATGRAGVARRSDSQTVVRPTAAAQPASWTSAQLSSSWLVQLGQRVAPIGISVAQKGHGLVVGASPGSFAARRAASAFIGLTTKK